MRRRRAACLFLVGFFAIAQVRAVASVEEHGWVLEHFGDAVTILRSGSGGAGPSTSGASMILSCDGPERRLTVTLPEAGATRLGEIRSGSILIRRPDRPNPSDAFVVAPFTVTGGTTLVISDRGSVASERAVLSVARILEGQPDSLAILIHPGPPPVTLSRLIALHQPVPRGPRNLAAMREFITACSRPRAPRIEEAPPARPR